MRKKSILIFLLFLTFGIFSVNLNASQTNAYDTKKIIFLGDSITAGTSVTNVADRFVNLIAAELGFTEFENHGVSGSRITKQAGVNYSLVERYSSLPNDADVVVVYAGVNDYWHGTAVFGETTSTTDTEFYGALNVLFTGLKAKYPTAEIIVMTPFKSYVSGNSGSTVPNASSGKTLTEYRDAIIARAKAHFINYIDLYDQIGFDADTSTTDRAAYTTDGVHLNVAGHRRLANILISWMQKKVFTAFRPSIFTAVDSNPGTLTNATLDVYSNTDYIPVEAGKSYIIFNEGVESFGTGTNNVGKIYNSAQSEIAAIAYDSGLAPRIAVQKMPEGAAFIRINYIEAKAGNVYIRELINHQTYKVSFNTNSGTDVKYQIVVDGDQAKLPVPPTREDFIFVGWYLNSTLTNLFSFSNMPITENITLYTKWTSSDGSGVVVPEDTEISYQRYLIIGGIALIAITGFAFTTPKKRGSRR